MSTDEILPFLLGWEPPAVRQKQANYTSARQKCKDQNLLPCITIPQYLIPVPSFRSTIKLYIPDTGEDSPHKY